MHARVTTVSAGTDELERWRRTVSERIAPTAGDKPGFVRAVWLLDEEAGRGISVTLWESREALDAAESAAAANRESLRAAAGGDMQVFRCEVVAEASAPG